MTRYNTVPVYMAREIRHRTTTKKKRYTSYTVSFDSAAHMAPSLKIKHCYHTFAPIYKNTNAGGQVAFGLNVFKRRIQGTMNELQYTLVRVLHPRDHKGSSRDSSEANWLCS